MRGLYLPRAMPGPAVRLDAIASGERKPWVGAEPQAKPDGSRHRWPPGVAGPGRGVVARPAVARRDRCPVFGRALRGRAPCASTPRRVGLRCAQPNLRKHDPGTGPAAAVSGGRRSALSRRRSPTGRGVYDRPWGGSMAKRRWPPVGLDLGEASLPALEARIRSVSGGRPAPGIERRAHRHLDVLGFAALSPTYGKATPARGRPLQ
jgi:hypothetical protein